MEAKINIAAILKDKPQGTKLYSLTYGSCFYQEYTGDFGIECQSQNGVQFNLDEYGRYCIDGECILFPLKYIHDWYKFTWKKGDVLVSNDGKVKVIFDKFRSDTYSSFIGKYHIDSLECNNPYYQHEGEYATGNFKLEEVDAVQTYINTIEERLGGKLNRETLEIEKFKLKKKSVFELCNLYVFNEQDEDGELTIIGKLIGKNESKDTLTFGNQYETENEKFVTDQVFDLRISVHNELREATEGEAITFQEAYTIWEKSKKQSAIKPFDKVLVRDSASDKWRANLFGYIGKDGYYCCVYANWIYCIPYEGNESLLGTNKDVEG